MSKSYNSYKAGELSEAKILIDSAAQSDQYKSQILTWYLKGFIYKDLFKKEPSDAARSEAVTSFAKLLEIDSTQKYEAESKQNLKYLASTYYNEAMQSLATNPQKSDSLFQSFEAAMNLTNDSTFDLKGSRMKYLLARGTTYVQKYRSDTTEVAREEAIASFQKVLALDSLNKKANYNLGVIYYNQAVNLILNADYDEIDILALSEFEDKSIELFEQSLPYMKAAYQVDPQDVNILEGLAGIYFGLKEFETSNKYKEELKALSE
ncbi:hypothetical protein [Fulvivirga aurantia]|uniref:hypothetical protein n=1 Tax=Fulvivirga aurantia TaxID=2529383 RepID=UPI0016231FDD|nr:hypothetical protein [Fulvivirga aurantia]